MLPKANSAMHLAYMARAAADPFYSSLMSSSAPLPFFQSTTRSNTPRIKIVATAREPTSQELADLWATHATYWNCCGPTETTIVNTMSRHVAGEPISIGRPTPNNTVYILDDDSKPVPEGVAGVMWAGGHGVSRGYVGLESKTKEAYIPDSFSNDG